MQEAYKSFDEIMIFNKVFPNSKFINNTFISMPKEEIFYVCKLPNYSIENNKITFHGNVSITKNKYLLSQNNIRSEVVSNLSIDDLISIK